MNSNNVLLIILSKPTDNIRRIIIQKNANLDLIQGSAVIIRSNIAWHDTQHYSGNGKQESRENLKRHAIPRPCRWVSLCLLWVLSGARLPCVNGIALYISMALCTGDIEQNMNDSSAHQHASCKHWHAWPNSQLRHPDEISFVYKCNFKFSIEIDAYIFISAIPQNLQKRGVKYFNG